MVIDLHTHSNASDGIFPPEEVARFAKSAMVDVFALTDHDTVAGVKNAQKASLALGMRFVPGCELSVTWHETTIHVVALGIRDDALFLARAQELSTLREARARKIASLLSDCGLEGTFDKAVAIAGNMLNISRRHFAIALVKDGIVKTEDEAFERFLGEKARAFVPSGWHALAPTMEMIAASGAVPVMAHPGRYKVGPAHTIEELLREFKVLGGKTIEVTTGSHTHDEGIRFAKVAREMGFYASTGSDFHGGRPGRPQPGCQEPLPTNLPTVLELLDF